MSRKLFFLISVGLLVGATAVQAGYDKVAYWDGNYTTNWADAATAQNVRDALEAAGYPIVNADELKTWMDGHIADKKLSVVIMCMDIFPDTVVETNTEDCTLRRYLNAGGKIVFYADIPFWNQSHANGTNTNWGQAGSTGILGFSSAPNAAPASWDQNAAVTITDLGVEWGLTETWSSVRPTAPDAWENMSVLAVDASGNPVGWAAHYVAGDTFRGFVRIRDVGGMPNVDDLIRLAEYGNIVGLALNPQPEDEAVDVLRDIDLSWSAGEFAATHNVYFGANWDDVNDGTGDIMTSMGQTDTSFDPGRLEFGRTYYWRIDEVNAAPDNAVYKGDVWSFEVEPFSYPIANVTATATSSNTAAMGPEKTVDGSGLNELDQHSSLATDMWLSGMGDPMPSIQYAFDQPYKLDKLLVWNSNQLIESFVGLGAKDVVVETSVDGAEWTALEGPIQFNQATGAATYTANTTVEFGGVMAQHVRITINSGWGMLPQYGLSEVRFFYIPVQAREPEPADGTTTDSADVTLKWRAGREAGTHEVSLGTDPAALSLIATVTDNSLGLADQDLKYDTTYYWQVREVNETETPTTHDGPVWSFTIPPYGTVESFETYDDLCNRIFFAWKDGLGHNGGEDVEDCDEPEFNGNGGGSIVGNAQAPFAERTVIRSGKQSMPFDYDNAFGDSYATLAIDGQDWSAGDVKTLAMSFFGTAGNTGILYIKINNTKITYDGPASDMSIEAWKTWHITLADTGANLSNVTSLEIGVDGANAQGRLYIDDIRLYPKVFEQATGISIAISAQANWWSQAAADREVQEIVDSVQGASVEVFAASDQVALATWVEDHTSNGASDLLILCGQLPDTIYTPGNGQADNSLVEMFLDNGNTVVNTGDWIFYVVNGAGTNGAGGLQTIMDIPGVTVAGEDNTAVTVTADGQQYTPSLQDLATDRPFHLDTLDGDWATELVLAQTADGMRADPVIVRNAVTGGRIGIFYQTASQDDDPRGEVISEWINNWYLPTASGGN